MEAYLNGNGTAANRCMSVFLRVIKGEYDRTLNWPVNLHMVVILVNQSGQNMECLKAGGHQFQFMQPQGHADSETDCWGLIEFVSHELIRRKDYISGDKIVIKCRLMILPS
ncbi:unnamed protein product [Lymnaea stagnalis]|uniref:MATH domain-containing protein n=1 Tax=Lymnaea stagnalis TaxID=6523 RepID=A0AAV2H620_LYMST